MRSCYNNELENEFGLRTQANIDKNKKICILANIY